MPFSIDQMKGLMSKKDGIARSNVFRLLGLPSIPGASSEEVNLLCREVQLPSRQIMTNERQIGLKTEKIPYGYAVSDISMTFHVLNDYGIRKYFEAWQNLAVDQNTFEIGYQKGKEGYAFQFEIQQLKKGIGLPVYSTKLGLPKLPAILQNRLPKIGPFDFAQGQLDLNYITNDEVIYSCKLIDAFPTGITAIPLSNEMDGLVELNIQMSYSNWVSNTQLTQSAQDKFTQTLIGTVLTNLAN
tara:strand:+ start:2836 stop:3561 length:726 start_codon:yes stop_codon:yes gene_type:complete